MPAPVSEASSTDRRLRWVLPAFLMLVYLWPTLLYPLARDSATFAFIGRVIAEGGRPYVDAWDLKPPGIYLLYALVAVPFRQDAATYTFALRVFDVALAMVTGWMLVRLALRAGFSRLTAAAAVAWYAALYVQEGFWGAAQTETWANTAVVGALLLAYPTGSQPPVSRGRLFAAALLAGTAATLKFTCALPALPVLLAAVWSTKEQRVSRLVLTAVGILLPLSLMAVWLLPHGAWDAFLDLLARFVAPYSRLQGGPLLKQLQGCLYPTGKWLLLKSPAVLCALFLVRRAHRAECPPLRLWAITLGAAYVAVCLQRKYFDYHWQVLFPALTLLAAAGSVRLLRGLRVPQRWVPAVMLLLPLLWTYGVRWSLYGSTASLIVGQSRYASWVQQFGPPHNQRDYSPLANFWAAEYIRRHTQPGESVLIWGFEPAVYLFADRFPRTRFFFNTPVSVHFAPEAWRREYLESLQKQPPELLLVVRNDAIPWASGRADDSAEQLRAWPELWDWVQRNYREEAQVEDFLILRRRRNPTTDFTARAVPLGLSPLPHP